MAQNSVLIIRAHAISDRPNWTPYVDSIVLHCKHSRLQVHLEEI